MVATLPNENMSKFIFFKKYLRNPESTGTVLPSSKALGKAICRVVENLEKVPIIEIGAGTGSLTQYLLKYDPLIVELERELFQILKAKFPRYNVQNCCGLKTINSQKEEFGLVSSIPTIHNPIKERLMNSISQKYKEGLLKWCVVYTYGLHDPFQDVAFRHHKRQKIVINNFPPAHIWVYC